MGRAPYLPLVAALALQLLAAPAFAKAHQWRFTEVFSNADGTVQFIEMFVFDPSGTQEWRLAGKTLMSDANTYVFPNDLPMENTFERWLLIATPAFAAVPGAPAPDYVIPASFFDPAGDALQYRQQDFLDLPAGVFPTDGLLSYDRDGNTALNTPTNFADEAGSIDVSVVCDDAVDNDGDGLQDWPADPGCQFATSQDEAPQCDDDLDNDGDGKVDWDGGTGGAPSDPQCTAAWRPKERRPRGCGLGAELAPLLALLATARRLRAHAPPARRSR